MAYKRKDGRYQITFIYDNKKYYVYGRTKKEAEAKKHSKLNDLKTLSDNRDNPSMDEYYKRFVEGRIKRVCGNTLRNQQKQYNNCSAVQIDHRKFGELKIKEVKVADCMTVQKALQEKLTTRGVNDTISHLKHVFNTAIREELITRNPCNSLLNLKRTEPLASETKHRALTVNETAAFFQEAENSYFINAFRLLIQTGLRCGELGALHNSDIDFVNNCIHVRKTVTRDEFGNYIIGDSTKTKSGQRDIPLTPTTIQIIKDQKELNRLVFGNIVQMDELLFKTPEGYVLRDYSINREIARVCKKSKIEVFTCHAFRSTFATRFIEQRPQDYKVLSEILGHASTKITLDLYTHVMTETKNTAMNNLQIVM